VSPVSDETRQIDDAIQGAFAEEGVVLGWHITVEVQPARGAGRYLAHRACDINGEQPHLWTAIGWLEGSLVSARRQLEEWTVDPEPPEPE
jgi:hypothetical protein